jgi:hypothetical protein
MRAARVRRLLPAALGIVISASALSACASSTSRGEETRRLEQQSIVSVDKHLISEREIARTPKDSASRAFLEYWSALQYQSWDSAVLAYAPDLAEAADRATLVSALQAQASYYSSFKPRIREEIRRDGDVVIRYLGRDTEGDPKPTSITWRRIDGRFRISYDPFLNGALKAYVQDRVQSEIDPLAEAPGQRAVRAGAAAERIQAEYLARTLSARTPSVRERKRPSSR